MTQRLIHKTFLPFLKTLLLVLFLITVKSAIAGAQENKISAATLLTRLPFVTLSGGIIVIELKLGNFPDTLNFILDTGSGGVSLDSSTVSYFHLPITPTEKRLRGIGSMRKISYVMDQTLHFPNLDVEHLDTGSGGVSLDSSTVSYFHLPITPTEKRLRGIGSMRKISYVMDQTLHFPNLDVEHLDIHINDYDLLTSVYGVKIDGIVGYSFLSRYIVKVNYDNSTLEIYSPGQIKYPRAGILIKPVINGIPSFDASISDSSTSDSRFYFDTGAGLCLLMSEAFEKDSGILSKGKKIILTQAEGLGGKTPMKLTTVREIRIGKYKFKKVPAHIFVDEFNVTAYPTLGGLIGNDLLRRFNLIINYGQREIHLKPNSHFREAFDYSYTGLGIYFVDNRVIIEDVLEGSPGEKAGLKPGDVIVGIDNNVTGNIQSYKNILQDVGAKIRLVVSRNGELMVKHLKVSSIL